MAHWKGIAPTRSLSKRLARSPRRADAAPSAATRRPPAAPVAIEALEDRRLLSATVAGLGTATHSLMPIIIPVARPASFGVVLHLTAGQKFGGYLGVLEGAKIPKGYAAAASVDWGDGTTPSASVVLVTPRGHIDVGGFHTYANAGTFAITVTVTAAPIPVPGQPTPGAILNLGTIHSKAIVAPSFVTGGVTLQETAGVPFTATVGSFNFPAPGTGLAASIEWGDGSSSAGTITPAGIIGVDVIHFNVGGSHTYAKAGTYPIIVTVTRQLGPPGSLTPIQLITTINSKAIVSPAAQTPVKLDGTITGTYSAAPTAANLGGLYFFNGSGTAGDLGPVGAAGQVHTPPFGTTAQPYGTLTLTQASAGPAAGGNSVTLNLTAKAQAATDPFPATLNYVIASGTGTFVNATGSGTIDVTFTLNSNQFTFVIHSATPTPGV